MKRLSSSTRTTSTLHDFWSKKPKNTEYSSPAEASTSDPASNGPPTSLAGSALSSNFLSISPCDEVLLISDDDSAAMPDICTSTASPPPYTNEHEESKGPPKNRWPDVWSKDQCLHFESKFPWLNAKDKKLGKFFPAICHAVTAFLNIIHVDVCISASPF
jgi:hypothetical protein